ncbi:MAG: hypothetical protein CW335_08460, partial [Clostridiales bacterium]|nr:hypothetical protein [Clostridiales bacterium]
FYFFTLSKTLKDRLPRHLRWLAMTNLFMLIFILTVTDFFDSLKSCSNMSSSEYYKFDFSRGMY